jgi:hypothetical protein
MKKDGASPVREERQGHGYRKAVGAGDRRAPRSWVSLAKRQRESYATRGSGLSHRITLCPGVRSLHQSFRKWPERA